MIIHNCYHAIAEGKLVIALGGYADFPNKIFVLRGIDKGEIFSVDYLANTDCCPFCNERMVSTSPKLEESGVMTNTEVMYSINKLCGVIADLKQVYGCNMAMGGKIEEAKQAKEEENNSNSADNKPVFNQFEPVTDNPNATVDDAVVAIDDALLSMCDGFCEECGNFDCEKHEEYEGEDEETKPAFVDYESLLTIIDNFVDSYETADDFSMENEELLRTPICDDAIKGKMDELVKVIEEKVGMNANMLIHLSMLTRAISKEVGFEGDGDIELEE